MQTTSDKYTLGGMCFSFLAAGRKFSYCRPEWRILLSTPFFLGDTTAYGTSWLMKEIHCSANKHFEPLKRIHEELDAQGVRGFLTYSEAPVRVLALQFSEYS